MNGRRGHRPRRLWIVVAVALGAAGAGLLALDLFPELQLARRSLVIAAAFSPYGIALWLAATVIALLAGRGRGRLLAVPLAAGMAAHLVVVAPYVPRFNTAASDARPGLSVLALNMNLGLADLDDLRRVVAAERPDLVILTEATDHVAATLDQPEWRTLLPSRRGSTGRDWDPTTGTRDTNGTLILSTVPVKEPSSAPGEGKNVAATLSLAGLEMTVVAGHPVNPTVRAASWQLDAQALTQLALAHADGPLIVAGDMNATAEHVTLRELEARAGVSDTATGQGWHPTFPANKWFPPMVQIDHVLVSPQFRTVAFETFRIADTDHLAVLARLVVAGP